MVDAHSRSVFERFADRTLPVSEWDHAAHLTVCWVALDSMEPAHALRFLRSAIREYNEATGVTNSTTGGYHETITEYFVGAVASLAATTFDEVIDADECRRSAPLSYWTRERLFSPTARAGWVDPDLVPLPWGSLDRLGGPFTDGSTAPGRPLPA